jgi:ribosomal protein S12 methylthiotransferase accessory factor
MTNRPIVFLGPSMPVTDARRVVDADFRPPVRRGDLAQIPAGQVVGIIDGVFEQRLAVSLSEVHTAVERGVVVYGGASMGALRAAEVPGVIGIGLVYSWYRDGIITRDDEVALLFDEQRLTPLTVPTVNIRYAVDRLQRMGTIDAATAGSLLDAALRLPFKERTYRRIARSAGLLDRLDGEDLVAMLRSHDLKYRDAQTVLEAIDANRVAPAAAAVGGAPAVSGNGSGSIVTDDPRSSRSALIWESGDRVTDEELFEFLVFTGRVETLAGSTGPQLVPRTATGQPVNAPAAQALFQTAVRRWGWLSPEEARVTLTDLGIDLVTLNRQCEQEAGARDALTSWATADPEGFSSSLRPAMFLHDMSLKREIMRLGALRCFAGLSSQPAGPEELAEARTTLCKVNLAVDFRAVQQRWAQWGCTDLDAQAAFVEQLARARRSGRELAATMAAGAADGPPVRTPSQHPDLPLGRRPKPSGDRRFCLPLETAREHAGWVAEAIGVTRVGMIGELGDLGGVQIAQAARPGGAWSSSYGSGKGLSEEGAYVGSVMEELEKWSQERFTPRAGELTYGSYAERADTDVVDPELLGLPYDTCYTPDLPLTWLRCLDAFTMAPVHVPLDVMVLERRPHDIAYSQRSARKVISTNGLGSGFSREEAVLHGACEYVERHAQRLAEISMANPGGSGPPPYRFVDPGSASDRVQELASRLGHGGDLVRILDITSDIRIPTFMATVFRQLHRADGYGTHPDPDTAAEMALLEAAQSIAGSVAGGREDLTVQARSLGRHERPRPIAHEEAWFWLDPDARLFPISSVDGLTSSDVYEDLQWSLARIRAAGAGHVVVLDLTQPDLEPAYAVRVLVPGLETNNPFFTGSRARLVLLRDLLPRWT